MYAKSLVAILLFPALVLAIPIFDTTFVSVVRWFAGRRLSQGGADHTSHRLVAVGLSERQAVLVLYAISIASGGLAFSLYRIGFSYAWFGAGMCLLALVLFGIFLSSVSVYPEEQVPKDGRVAGLPRFTLATQFMYKRAMLWVFVDVLAIVLAYYAGFMLRYAHCRSGGCGSSAMSDRHRLPWSRSCYRSRCSGSTERTGRRSACTRRGSSRSP